jgi:hypothetical protein
VRLGIVATAGARSGPLTERQDAGRGVDSGKLPQPPRLGKWEIAMIFTARKKKLCIRILGPGSWSWRDSFRSGSEQRATISRTVSFRLSWAGH